MRTHIEILIALKKCGTSTPRQVAANCHFCPETIYGHLKSLAEKGHAKVHPITDDAKVHFAYTITKQGMDMLRAEERMLLAEAARLREALCL